jgi:hypothetical protein
MISLDIKNIYIKMVFEERLEYLKKIIKEQKEIKKDAVDKANEHLGLVNTVVEMEEIKKEAHKQMLEQKIDTKIQPKLEPNPNQLQIEDQNHIKTFEPMITDIADDVIKLGICPIFQRNTFRNKENSLSINNTKFIMKENNDGRKWLTPFNDADKDKKDVRGWEFTEDLNKLIYGHGTGDEPYDLRKAYLDLLKEAKAPKNSTYYQKIRGEGEERIEGYGYELGDELGDELEDEDQEYIHFMPDNPILLFIELRKLLAAKKAGHDNTYNQVNAILKRLMERKIITPDRYKKILNKHYS